MKLKVYIALIEKDNSDSLTSVFLDKDKAEKYLESFKKRVREQSDEHHITNWEVREEEVIQ